MRVFLTTLLLIFFPQMVLAQNEIVAGMPHLQTDFKLDDFVGRDAYGNLYGIRSNNFLKIESDRLLEYRNVAGGRITRADITNPLLIVLFYADFNLVVLLDNQLNEVRRIDFNTLEGPIVVQAVGLASQNRLWIYDAISLKLGLYDLTRNNLKPISVPLTEPPVEYQSDYNHFQWITQSGNWYACDLFGKTASLGKMQPHDGLQLLSDGAALILKDGVLHYRKPAGEELISINGVEKSFKKFYYDDQILTIFTDFGITNYKITLP